MVAFLNFRLGTGTGTLYQSTISQLTYYHLKTKLWGGNVFTHVCLLQGGVRLPKMPWGRPPPPDRRQTPSALYRQTPPPPIGRWSTNGQCASY